MRTLALSLAAPFLFTAVALAAEGEGVQSRFASYRNCAQVHTPWSAPMRFEGNQLWALVPDPKAPPKKGLFSRNRTTYKLVRAELSPRGAGKLTTHGSTALSGRPYLVRVQGLWHSLLFSEDEAQLCAFGRAILQPVQAHPKHPPRAGNFALVATPRGPAVLSMDEDRLLSREGETLAAEPRPLLWEPATREIVRVRVLDDESTYLSRLSVATAKGLSRETLPPRSEWAFSAKVFAAFTRRPHAALRVFSGLTKDAALAGTHRLRLATHIDPLKARIRLGGGLAAVWGRSRHTQRVWRSIQLTDYVASRSLPASPVPPEAYATDVALTQDGRYAAALLSPTKASQHPTRIAVYIAAARRWFVLEHAPAG